MMSSEQASTGGHRLRRGLRSALLAGMLPLAAWAVPGSSVVSTDQARAELIAHAPEGVAEGKPVWLGLKIEHRPHWHTYWKNPGDSGLPTSLSFELPPGFSTGSIEWPTPKQQPVGPLMNFGYDGTLLLPVKLAIPAGFAGDAVDIKLRADWLICKDVCIPEGGEFQLRLPAAAATAAHAALFDAAFRTLPRPLPAAKTRGELRDGALAVTVDGLPAAWQGREVQLLPELAGVIDNAAKPVARWQGAQWQAQVPLSPQRSESPTSMSVVLVAAGEAVGVTLPIAIKGPWPAAGVPSAGETAVSAAPAAAAGAVPTGQTQAPPSLWAALALAFVGGMLLNLMPCVFPVLSLKVIGFAGHADDRRALLAGGLAYTAGVVASFLALAGLLLALRAAGDQIGWGFQLQSPAFVAALAALFTLIGLNLAGVFEVASFLPSAWATAQARHPVVDAGLTGVLAVAVASPCTAPFMGASLGLAATLPAVQALAIFAALGLGMALPYLLASAWPRVARALPRPGAWMAHLKTVLAFPMFATVVWLAWVFGQQAGVDAVAALLGTLLALSFAAWVMGTNQLGRKARVALSALAAVVLAVTLVWAAPALHQQAAAAPAAAGPGAWQPWSNERVAAARAEGRAVFVDFTAAWCVTCQYNKRTTLADAQVLADFESRKVLLLRADWTRRDAAITAELARLNRNGVPVYALYAPGAAQPKLLNEVLTVREVREALEGLP